MSSPQEKDIARRIQQRVKGLAAHSHGEEIDPNAIWQTVYGDMMTNMMLFFLMMFALNMVGEDLFSKSSDSFKNALSGKKPEKSLKQSPQQQADRLRDFFAQFAAREKNVQLIEKGEGVKIRLPEPVLFDVGKADLKDEAKQLLHEFAKGLKSLPHIVVVEGHTDDVPVKRGAYKSNWELSEARAEAVVNYLIMEEGVPPRQLAVAGFGEHWPFVPNDSPVNRALNRRIELLVVTDGLEG